MGPKETELSPDKGETEATTEENQRQETKEPAGDVNVAHEDEEPSPKARGRPKQSQTPKSKTSRRTADETAAHHEAETPSAPRSSRRAAAPEKYSTPNDDPQRSHFPCPVKQCGITCASRQERSFHMRQDHPHYDEATGEDPDATGAEKQPRKRATRPETESTKKRVRISANSEDVKPPKDEQHEVNRDDNTTNEDQLIVIQSQDSVDSDQELNIEDNVDDSHEAEQPPFLSPQTKAPTAFTYRLPAVYHDHDHGVAAHAAPAAAAARSVQPQQQQTTRAASSASAIQTAKQRLVQEQQQQQPSSSRQEHFAGELDVGREEDLEEDYEDEADGQMQQVYRQKSYSRRVASSMDGDQISDNSRRRGRPKNPPGHEPSATSKVRVGDPDGKYACYVPECDWRGGYRSIRAEHMKWCHKDWVMPSRFLLQRITKDGIFIDPEQFEPEFGCLIEGCPWRGNFRASRSAHMRNEHPDYIPEKMKASSGGYVADGRYDCHIPNCGWRGASRSTRANHMKREHPNFVNPVYAPRSVQCCDCDITCTSHKNFVDHMVVHHRIGGIVQREFFDVRDYEEWFDAVQESFSIEFIKRMGVKTTESYQVLYLYCARSGGYRPKRLRSSAPYIPEYSRVRSSRGVKCGKNCTAFLRVIHWIDGRLNVVGCVEHTGHRLGTPLLRLSAMEREAMDEYLYVVEDDTPLEYVLERLRELEGYSVDGYDVRPREADEIRSFMHDEDEVVSLQKLLLSSHEFPPGSTFQVHLVQEDGTPALGESSFGIMTDEMKHLWTQFAHRAVCIQEVRLMINSWDLSLFYVLVFDDSGVPRCCCVYLTQIPDKLPLLEHLRNCYDGPIETFVTDCAAEWPALIEQYFGEANAQDVQIAEWHLLPEWAAQCDQLIGNRVDRFTFICALRRWIRASDPLLFEGMVIDMFEALREMELDEFAQQLDVQLTDPEYAKRWTPLNRNPLTHHDNPMLELVCRTFRERYLNCEQCYRLDQYAGLLLERIKEFNCCEISDIYTTRQLEPPREVPQMYANVDPNNMLADGTVMMPMHIIDEHDEEPHPHPHHEPQQMVVKRQQTQQVMKQVSSDYVEEEVVEEVIVGEDAIQYVSQALAVQHQQLTGPILEAAADVDEAAEEAVVDGQAEDGDGAVAEPARKKRIEDMMQMIRDKVEVMADDEMMELVESGLSHVLEQNNAPGGSAAAAGGTSGAEA